MGRKSSAKSGTKKAGIKDVAKAAAVSVGTVSHFLNGRTVSAERAGRIRKAIDDLGFTSNLLAKGMRLQRSSVIGLCVPYTTLWSFSWLVDELERRVSEAGYEVMQVLSRQDPALEFRRIERLVAYQVGGLVLIPSIEPQAMLDYLHRNGVPTVLVNRLVEEEERFDQVSVDHRQTMVKVVQEFIRRGHRELLFVARYPALVVTRQRLEGFRIAIAGSGERVRYKMIVCGEDQAAYAAQLEAAMKAKNRPTGLIFSNALMADWTLRVLRQLDIRYPKDVSLITMDNAGWAELVTPQLSHVRPPVRELADITWRVLSDRMKNPDGARRRILLDSDIRWRES